MSQELRARWEAHYASGHTPWDTRLTPPEVQAFWRGGRLPAQGLALDVGCGPGTNVGYLAQQGLRAIGFDIAEQALRTGSARLVQRAPGLAGRALLVQADVTALPLAQAGAVYILDIGCSHGIDPALRERFAAGIVDNLRAGGYYHLYGFDFVARFGAEGEDRSIGFGEHEVVRRFTPALEVVEIVRAEPDPYPCRWYLLRKPHGRSGDR